MRLPPKLKAFIQDQADKDIRDLTKEIIVLLSEAIHFRKSGIRLHPEYFHISDYTDGWDGNQGNKRKLMLDKLVETIKLELEESSQ